MTLRNCDAAHCGAADAELNAVCIQEGWSIGHPVITRDASGPCQCHCSCLALGTPVEIDNGATTAIENIAVGDLVLAAGLDLDWAPVTVQFSNGTTSGVQPGCVFVRHERAELVVTADHLFLCAGRLVRADRLNTADTLTDLDGKPVGIRNVEIGTFSGGFHHVATTTKDPEGDLTNHLIVTAGVVSADYAVQLYHSANQEQYKVIDYAREFIVGTDSYENASREISSGQAEGISRETHVNGNPQSLFLTREATRLSIPNDAVSFVSDREAVRLQAAGDFRPLTDPHAREWTDYLFTQYRAFYPDVDYSIDWFNETVNAFAWIENGRRKIALLGGLIRHNALDIEGIAVVIAHELAHHYGGVPTYPGSPLSCEGQADFVGVRTVMRKAWFGEYYFTVASKGISQMAKFFGAVEPGSNSGSAGCQHPDGRCRIYTYNAAVNLMPKPSCAS